MRTTNKEFKAVIRKHIEERLEDTYTQSDFLSCKLETVVAEFGSWWCKYEQKRNPNKSRAFQDWLMGLPSCFNIEFTHYDISKTLEQWFSEVMGSYRAMDSDKEQELYLHLITREFRQMCAQNKIDF